MTKKKLRACYLNHQAAKPGPLARGSLQASRRSAAVVLELILALPVLVIIVVAIVQFGLFFQNLQQLALASRVGAHEAAETAMLPNEGDVTDDPVPTAIVTAVTQQLNSSGIDPCAIILEHNVNQLLGTFPEQTLRTDFDNDADSTDDCPDCEEPNSAIPIRTVRVTVCVKMDELMPNCLAIFGFDTSTYTSQSSTTFCYEVEVN